MKAPHLGRNRLVGYARVSTFEQSLDLQLDALRKRGVHDDNLWQEFVSGVDSRRPQLELALMDARAGDTLVVWKLDRFGRNAMEVMERIEALGKRNVAFESLTERFETHTAMGRLIFGMHALFAQLERDVIRERTLAGMAAARARGRMPGQPSKLSKAQWANVERMLIKGATPAECAEKYGVSRQTVYVRYPSERIAELRLKNG